MVVTCRVAGLRPDALVRARVAAVEKPLHDVLGTTTRHRALGHRDVDPGLQTGHMEAPAVLARSCGIG